MKISIDGKDILVKDASKNLVEIADEHGISIPAPCFRNKKKGGCCKACVVEADGEKAYACATHPREGMAITYGRKDLKELRRDRLRAYSDNIKSGKASQNTCGCSSQNQEDFIMNQPSSCC